MLLAIDIGNSNIVMGGYREETVCFVSRFRTDSLRTEFEYAVLIKNILSFYEISPQDITGGIISSVVPPLSDVMKKAVCLVKKVRVLTIGPGMKTGLNIKIDNRDNLAPICWPLRSGQGKYPLPAVVIDLGTATKITVVDKDGCFRGGAIMPGVMISLDALDSAAALLQKIGLDNVQSVQPIGTNTVDCMKSGTSWEMPV